MNRTIKRRRKQTKTDYKARLALLKSGKPRFVVRKTNRYIIAQIVQTDIAQDKIIKGINSKELLSKGWPKEKSGSLKSLPAAYLTGYLLAALVRKKIKEAILDIGLQRNVHKSRIYAALKGAIDAGLKIPSSEKALPTIEEIKGQSSVASLIEKIKGEIK